MRKILTLLALEPNASESEIDSAYKELRETLDPKNFSTNSKAAKQADLCITALEGCFSSAGGKDEGALLKPKEAGETRPRLGQLCVASGMISMEQLQEAVEAQLQDHLPLGEILQKKQFISGAELDGLLLGQEMIDIPSACTDPVGVRLVLFDLVSEDMVLIAQMEQKAQGKSVAELIQRHSWVEPEILSALGV